LKKSLCYFYLDPAYEKAFLDRGCNLVLFQGLQMDLDGLFGVSQGFIDGFSLRIAARQNRDF
jgi:hypothetical protein